MPTAIAARRPLGGIVADEEHNLFELHIEDRSTGYPRRHTLTADFLTTGEYRPLPAATATSGDYLHGALRGRDRAARRRRRATTAAGDADGRRAAASPSAGAQAPRPEEHVTLDSLDALVEYFIAAGKKGSRDQPLQGPRRDEPGTALGRPR